MSSIAITGSGIICSIGSNSSEVYESLRDGVCGISAIEHTETALTHLPAGEVKMSNDELKRLAKVVESRDMSRTTLLGVIALRQALNEAGVNDETLRGRRVVFISGTTVGGMDLTERHYEKMQTDADEAGYIGGHDCGSNTEEIARICGLDVEFATISTACSSALNAITVGSRMLLDGEADIVIAGGTESLSRFHLNGFNSLMILDSEACRPFDNTRRGLNLGEGAAYLVLERKSDADSRDAKTLAYVGGFGNRCDAFHQTATSENGEGAYLAMKDALEMSGVAPKDIDYVNAHGTGTPDNDRSESQALIRIFSEELPPVSSTKTFTGHTTSASGSIESVISMLAMHNSFIPANLRFDNKDEGCIEPSLGVSKCEIHNVLCNSFGFGGNDSSLVICDHPVDLMGPELAEVSVSGECEISDAEGLKELRRFISPMESRRMNKLMKAAFLTSYKALEAAGIEKPDAIVEATRFGMLEQGEKILDHISENGEVGISPTLFMQSTHNTLAGALAIRLGCHGYNITYSHGEHSLQLALDEARRLLSEGLAENVLVGIHDECPEKFRELYCKAGIELPKPLYSRSMIIQKKI